MRVLFLRPDSGIMSSAPPMGLLSLTAYLRKYGDYEISIIDARATLMTAEQVKPLIKEQNPDIIGLTAFSVERKQAHELVRVAKELFPHVPVIMGGPYVTGEWETVIADRNVDYAVIGEGETTLLNLLKNIEEGVKYPELKGIAYRENDDIRFLGFPEFITDLDTIPMSAWEAIDLEFYFNNKKKRASMNPHPKSSRSIPFFTTRGCPYHCTYCHNVFGKRIRKRSVEHVMDELIYLKRNHNIKEIDIIDDIFNLDKERVHRICDRMIEEKLNLGIAFPNGLRTDIMDEELVDKLVAAGAYRFIYAIESGSPRIQKLVKKNLNLKKARHIVNYTASKNVSVGGFFMLGFLEETEEEMRMTIDFAVKSKMVTASFFILQPFPNTEIYNQAIELGYSLPKKQQEQYYGVTYNISKVPKENIDKLRNWAVRKFYFDPWRVYRFFRTTPFKYAFWTKVKMILSYLFKTNPEEKGAKL